MVIKRGVNILWVTEKQGSKFYVAKAGRVKILWKLKYGGQNSIFFSWNPWSKFYVPWKGGSKFYIFSQCLEKGGSKPRSLPPTNFTEGVPPPPGSGYRSICLDSWLLTVDCIVYSDIVNTFKSSYLHSILSIVIIETPECQHCIVWQWAAFWAWGNGKFTTINKESLT